MSEETWIWIFKSMFAIEIAVIIAAIAIAIIVWRVFR